MFDILYAEYKKNKKFILTYVSIAVILAFVAGPFLNINNMNVALAEELTGLETVETLNKQVFNQSLQKFVGNYSNVIAISAEPITGMLFLGTVQYVNNLCGSPISMEPVPVGQIPFIIVLAVFFVGLKLMKVFEGTKVIGDLTLGTLSHFMGTVCVLAMGLMCVVGLASIEGANVVNAAGLADAAKPVAGVFTGIFSAILAAVMTVSLLAITFVVKTVARALGIVEMIFSHAEIVTVACELLKSGIVVAFCSLNLWLYNTKYGIWVSLAIDMIVFVVCCILFRICYRLTKYYANIFAKPMLNRIFRRKKQRPLVPAHLPSRVKKAFKGKTGAIEYSIPVYIEKCSSKSPLPFKKYDKTYFVGCEGSNYIIIKKYEDKMNYTYNMDNTEGRPVFLRKGKTRYEVYSFLSDEKNMAGKSPKKELSFVFSKDYRFVTDKIFEITGYIDIVEEKAQIKAEKKLSRKEKRKEGFANFKAKVKEFFSRDEDDFEEYSEDYQKDLW